MWLPTIELHLCLSSFFPLRGKLLRGRNFHNFCSVLYLQWVERCLNYSKHSGNSHGVTEWHGTSSPFGVNANITDTGKITVSNSTVGPSSFRCKNLSETGEEHNWKGNMSQYVGSPNVMLPGKCVALNMYVEKDRPQISELSFHITKPEKVETIKPKQAERRK